MASDGKWQVHHKRIVVDLSAEEQKKFKRVAEKQKKMVRHLDLKISSKIQVKTLKRKKVYKRSDCFFTEIIAKRKTENRKVDEQQTGRI